MPIQIPSGFVEELDRLSGPAAQAWLSRLPERVTRALQQWSLTVDGDARHGAHALVIPVRQGTLPLALKIALPDTVFANELAGLRAWDGHGTVEVIETMPEDGVLLLERLDANRDLTSLPLDEAIREAGCLTRHLAIAPHPSMPFPTTASRASAIAATMSDDWNRVGRPFPRERLERSVALAARLAARTPAPGANRLATWDLHSENVLWGERAGWTMIDPMPLVGDPEVALAPFLWTRTEEIAGPTYLARLLSGYVASGDLDPGRVTDWLAVRLADYWLWGLGIGLTIDPERCRILLGWLDELHL